MRGVLAPWGVNIFSSSGALATRVTAWTSCRRTRYREVRRGPQTAGHGEPSAAATAAVGPTSEGRERSRRRPATARPGGESQPRMAGHLALHSLRLAASVSYCSWPGAACGPGSATPHRPPIRPEVIQRTGLPSGTVYPTRSPPRQSPDRPDRRGHARSPHGRLPGPLAAPRRGDPHRAAPLPPGGRPPRQAFMITYRRWPARSRE